MIMGLVRLGFLTRGMSICGLGGSGAGPALQRNGRALTRRRAGPHRELPLGGRTGVCFGRPTAGFTGRTGPAQAKTQVVGSTHQRRARTARHAGIASGRGMPRPTSGHSLRAADFKRGTAARWGVGRRRVPRGAAVVSSCRRSRPASGRRWPSAGARACACCGASTAGARRRRCRASPGGAGARARSRRARRAG